MHMERTVTRRIAAGAAALALIAGGGVLAGCGSSSDSSSGGGASTAASTAATTAAPNGIEGKTATEILDASLAAANKATSVTAKGAITQGGQEIKLDLQVGQEAAQGSISAQGAEIEIKVLAGKTYFKLSGESFAKIAGQDDSPEVAKAISALLGDKWLVAPDEESAGQLGSLGQFGQKDELLKGILTPDGNATVKGTGEVNGQPVVLLESTDGTGTLAIATTGEPYPLQIKGSEGADGGQIDFTDWNAPVNVTAPTDVLDIGQLADLGGASSG
jgi:hypothetical protein